jgi:hypothetical protein
MRRAENTTIDLGVFGISVVITVLFGLCFSIFKALRAERLPREAPEPERAGTRPTGAPAPQQARAVEPESRS